MNPYYTALLEYVENQLHEAEVQRDFCTEAHAVVTSLYLSKSSLENMHLFWASEQCLTFYNKLVNSHRELVHNIKQRLENTELVDSQQEAEEECQNINTFIYASRLENKDEHPDSDS